MENKVQDFIKYLQKNYKVKITKEVYSTYDDWYFISPKKLDQEMMKKIVMEYTGINGTSS
jgi:hypothetical protein